MAKFNLSIVPAVVVALVAVTAVPRAQTPNPTAAQTAQARTAAFCTDPWITLALWNVTAGTRNPGGAGALGECNPQLYNSGSWSNYDQLLRAVSAISHATPGVFNITDNHNGRLTITTTVSGFQSWVQVPGRIVSQGAGNIILNGGGNIMAQGGSNIILNGGGNYRLQSADQKLLVLPPGNRILIVTKAPSAPPR
jgi:hypothetical protein